MFPPLYARQVQCGSSEASTSNVSLWIKSSGPENEADGATACTDRDQIDRLQTGQLKGHTFNFLSA